MRTFPIMLSEAGLQAVVVGGGPVGLRKAQALLRAGAAVTLVDPSAPLQEGKRLRVLRERYKASHLRGARLVMACTDDRRLNHRVAVDARKAGALVNAADQPEDCDFYLPAVVRQGEVVVAIGTGGSAPALAGDLKRAVAAALPPEVGPFAAALSRLRAELKERTTEPKARMAIMKSLSRSEGYRRFLAGGAAALREYALELSRKKNER